MQLRRESELARLRSDFIASVSHELRTPLAQVRMFAETLLLGRVRSEEERLRSLQIVDQEARRLTHLVENILQFSRAEREAIRLAPVPSELASQVREAVEAFAPVARSRHVVVQTALENDVVCVVDPAALRQILLNLLDNAVKYGPLGQTVTITLRRTGRSRADHGRRRRAGRSDGAAPPHLGAVSTSRERGDAPRWPAAASGSRSSRSSWRCTAGGRGWKARREGERDSSSSFRRESGIGNRESDGARRDQ